MVDQNAFPDMDCVGDFACGQRLGGSEVEDFARGRAGACTFGRAEGGGDAWMIATKSAQQEQRSDGAAAQTKARIVVHRTLQSGDGIALPAEVVGDGAIKRTGRFV